MAAEDHELYIVANAILERDYHTFMSSVEMIDDLDSIAGDGTLLQIACHTTWMPAVKRLIELGASVNPQNRNLITPLHSACIRNHESMVKLLLARRASVNAADSEGRTPLYYACRNRNDRVIADLLDWGADPNIPCDEGYLIHLICRQGMGTRLFRAMVLTYGMDIHVRDGGGRTAREVAEQFEHTELVEVLQEIEETHRTSGTLAGVGESPEFLSDMLEIYG